MSVAPQSQDRPDTMHEDEKLLVAQALQKQYTVRIYDTRVDIDDIQKTITFQPRTDGPQSQEDELTTLAYKALGFSPDDPLADGKVWTYAPGVAEALRQIIAHHDAQKKAELLARQEFVNGKWYVPVEAVKTQYDKSH